MDIHSLCLQKVKPRPPTRRRQIFLKLISINLEYQKFFYDVIAGKKEHKEKNE